MANPRKGGALAGRLLLGRYRRAEDYAGRVIAQAQPGAQPYRLGDRCWTRSQCAAGMRSVNSGIKADPESFMKPPLDDRPQSPALASNRMPAWTRRRATRRLLPIHQGCIWLGLTLLALVACAHQRVTFTPDPLQGIAPIHAQVDPHLWTLTERWESWSTSGEVPVGELLRQVLIDDPQVSMRLTYVASQLHVATVVSTTSYRPNAHQAFYQLSVRVESPATDAGQVWLEGRGEGRSLASAGRAARDASIQAVQDLSRKLVILPEAHDHRRQRPGQSCS